MKVILLFLIFWISLPAFSATPSVQQSVINGTEIIFYPENGGWIVESFLNSKGKLPQKTGRWFFGSKEQADKFLSSRFKNVFRPLDIEPLIPQYLTEVPGEVIWKAENQWSEVWEHRYAQWVRANVHADFFKDYRIATDCADVAYATRWIFARIHALPVANRITSGRLLLTNSSMRAEWAKLPTHADWSRDTRFRAALDYLLNLTYTHTLKADSYPIKIHPQTLTEGTHHLSIFGSSGHTLLVNEINVNHPTRLPIYVVASTIPRDIRSLDPHFYFQSEMPTKESGGFLKFRWPTFASGQWSLTDSTAMPGYSQEQYDPQFVKAGENFGLAVFKRINPDFDVRIRLKEGFDELNRRLISREEVVRNGYAFCKTNDCSPGTENYENWSTPSRDKRIAEVFLDIRTFIGGLGPYFPELKTLFDKSLKETTFDFSGPDYPLSLFEILFANEIPSSDPRDSIEARWAYRSNHYVEAVRTRLTKLLQTRQGRLAMNSCLPKTCTPDSSEYFESQTYDLDHQIRKVISPLGSYCAHVAAGLCSDFEMHLRSALVVLEKPLSLTEALKRAPWLNSDPRWPDPIRWGTLGERFPSQSVSGFIGQIQSSLNDFLFVVADAKQFLYRLTDMELLSQTPVAISSELNSRNGVLASLFIDTLEVFDPKSGVRASTSVQVDYDSVVGWINDRRLVLRKQDRVLLYDYTGSSLHFVSEYVGSYFNILNIDLDYNSCTLFAHSSDAEGFSLVDLAAPMPSSQRYVFKGDRLPDTQVWVIAHSETSAVIQYPSSDTNSPNKSFVLDLKTGETRSFEFQFLTPLGRDRHFLGAVTGSTHWVKLNSEFQILERKDLPGNCTSCAPGSIYFTLHENTGHAHHFSIESGEPFRFVTPDQQKVISGSGQEVLLLNLSSKQASVQNFQGQTLLRYPMIEQVFWDTRPSGSWLARIENKSNGVGLFLPTILGERPLLTSGGPSMESTPIYMVFPGRGKAHVPLKYTVFYSSGNAHIISLR